MKGRRLGKCLASVCLWQLWQVKPRHHASFYWTSAPFISPCLSFLNKILSFCPSLVNSQWKLWGANLAIDSPSAPIYWNIIQLPDVASLKETCFLKINVFFFLLEYFFPRTAALHVKHPVFSMSQFHGGPMCTCLAARVAHPEKLRLAEQTPRTMPVLRPGTAGDSA